MNPLKKLYCRTFQTMMRIALPFLPYREPKLVDGLNGIPAVLQSHGIQNILLITDSNIHKLGLTTPLRQPYPVQALLTQSFQIPQPIPPFPM